MKALIFFIIVFGVVAVLAYYLRKSSASARADLARKEREVRREKLRRSAPLATPGNNRLANNQEVWRARRQHVALVSESADKTTGQRYFKYRKDAEPEYDGYSRTDRHHITPARIKDEPGLDDRDA